MNNNLIFTEKLKLFKWNSLLVWVGFGLIFTFLAYYQITDRNDYTDNTKNFILGLIIFLVSSFFLVTSFLAYFIARLNTEISKEYIKIKYLRFIEKKISWKQVESAEIVTCKIVGNKLATGWENYGASKNKKGSNAMALVLKNGEKLLVGTENGAELNEIIEKILGPMEIGYDLFWFYSTPKNKL